MIEKRKILLIEDDSFLLDMYGKKFEKDNFEVQKATNGQDAIELLKNGFEPNVIMIDLIMPIMDGFSILNKIKEKKLAVNSLYVVLSNQSTSADLKKAKETGFHDFIIKSDSIPSSVVERINNLLESNK